MKQGDKTRLYIINTADDLFYHQGYSNTSFANIVDKTGLSKGNITYHFNSKKNILKAIIEKRTANIEQLLATWDQAHSDPLLRLIYFCDMLVTEQEDLKRYGCPIGTLTSEFSKNEPELYHITLPLFQSFRHWLKQQFLLLNYSAIQADEKGMALLARAQGIAILTHAFKDKDFLTREIDKLKNLLKTDHSQI